MIFSVTAQASEIQSEVYGNDRYKYRSYTTYSEWKTVSISITESQAKKIKETSKIPAVIINEIVCKYNSTFANSIAYTLENSTGFQMYKAGTYTFKTRIAYNKKENILTGATYIESKVLEIGLYYGGSKIQSKNMTLK